MLPLGWAYLVNKFSDNSVIGREAALFRTHCMA